MESVFAVIHGHVNHFVSGLRHLIICCIISHLPLNGEFHHCWTGSGLQTISHGQLPLGMQSDYYYSNLVQNTHIGEGAIKECKASQVRDHLELVVSNRNSRDGNLDFNYVSNSKSRWLHLAKPGQEHYKKIIFVLLGPLSPGSIVDLFQNIINHLVIFSVKIFVVGHAQQQAVWVHRPIKWHFSAIRVIPSRCEVTCGKLHHIKMMELPCSEGFHITLRHLTCKHLMQTSKCTNTGLELITVKTCQLHRLTNERLVLFVGSRESHT